jgi:hypothetical protein
MSVIKIVPHNTSYDMQDYVYPGNTENYKGEECEKVHFPVKHPQECKTEAAPVPCDAEFFSPGYIELCELLQIVMGIGSKE